VTQPGLEAEVRARLEAGDSIGATDLVIRALGPAIRGVLHALHGEDDGDDVFSTWEVGVLTGLPAFRWECSLRTWAFRIARHASHRLWRDPYRARRDRLATSAASRLAASTAVSRGGGAPDPRLEALRADLTRPQLELIALRTSRELSWAEIAGVLASEGETVTPETLRKRYERLKDQMSRKAKQRGLL